VVVLSSVVVLPLFSVHCLDMVVFPKMFLCSLSLNTHVQTESHQLMRGKASGLEKLPFQRFTKVYFNDLPNLT